jgi:hypothetical protein
MNKEFKTTKGEIEQQGLPLPVFELLVRLFTI